MIDRYLVEASAFALFVYLGITAYRKGPRDVVFLFASAVYGLLIELMFVHFAGGYEYGSFLVMISGAPLWVAAGWGVIMYGILRAVRELDVAEWSKPAAAGLMAVSLDFALDPIAEALGWWHWKRPDPGFFEVSYDNFVGWLLIVGSFVGASMPLRKWWGPLVALPISVAIVAGCTPVLEAIYPHTGEGAVLLVVHTVFVAVAIAGARPRLEHLVVPAYFHALFIGLLFAEDLTDTAPELYGVFALASSLSLLWFTPRPREPQRSA